MTPRGAAEIGPQDKDHRLGVDAIRLHTPTAPRHEKARRIEKANVDAVSPQNARQPEAIVADFITELDFDSLFHAPFRLRRQRVEILHQRLRIATGKITQLHLFLFRQERCSEPLLLAEFEAHINWLNNVGGVLGHAGVSFFKDNVSLRRLKRRRQHGIYYRTCFHELGHWTGHKDRLARDLSHRFGSEPYAREELVAEMASAFVCASLSIVPTVRHTDYIGAWLDVLKEDNRAIFRAASQASKAADFILAFQGDAL